MEAGMRVMSLLYDSFRCVLGSQQCVNVALRPRTFKAIPRIRMASKRRNSVHGLVHARVRHYCLLLRLPAKLCRQTGLSFCECYANPRVDMRCNMPRFGLKIRRSLDPDASASPSSERIARENVLVGDPLASRGNLAKVYFQQDWRIALKKRWRCARCNRRGGFSLTW